MFIFAYGYPTVPAALFVEKDYTFSVELPFYLY